MYLPNLRKNIKLHTRKTRILTDFYVKCVKLGLDLLDIH